MELKTFYFCEATNKEIPADNPVFLSKAHAIANKSDRGVNLDAISSKYL